MNSTKTKFSSHEKLIFNSLQYAIVTISTIGIFTNALTFQVFQSKRFKNLSFAFFFKALVLFNILVLILNYNEFANQLFNHVIDNQIDFTCRFLEYFTYIAAGLTYWTIDLNLLDRFFSIVYFRRFPILENKYAHIASLGVIALFNGLIYIPIPFFRQILPQNTEKNNFTCAYSSRSHSYVIYWIDFANCVLSGFIVNNILSIAIIRNLINSRKRANRVINQHMSKEIKFAINMIVLNFVDFALKIPVTILLLYGNYFSITLTYGKVQILFSIGVLLFTINCSSALLINLISNSMFRTEFVSMTSFRFLKKNNSQETRHRD